MTPENDGVVVTVLYRVPLHDLVNSFYQTKAGLWKR